MPRHPERAINLLLAPSAWSQSAHDCLATPSVSASLKAGSNADFVGPEMILLAKGSKFSEPFSLDAEEEKCPLATAAIRWNGAATQPSGEKDLHG